MLVIHHLGVSQSERVIWLCEELGLPYELVRYERDPVTRLAPADYKALHRFGTAPVIDDDGVRLGESGAIVEYIIHTHGGGRLSVSPGAPNYADYLYWWHFANASLLPAAMIDAIVRQAGSDGPMASALSARLAIAYAMIEARLGETAYFAGEHLTAADILMVFPLTTMRSFSDRDISDLPNLRAYLRRIGGRPAYRRAMAKGDPAMTPLLD